MNRYFPKELVLAPGEATISARPLLKSDVYSGESMILQLDITTSVRYLDIINHLSKIFGYSHLGKIFGYCHPGMIFEA